MAYLKSRSKNDIISLCMLLLCLGCVESNDGDDEAAYMLKLMNALNPPGWSNTTHMCEWSGVACNDQSGIERLDLTSMSLTGTVPAGLNDSLSQLAELVLSNNSLSGPVPSLANLTFLHYVSLENNNFTSIPHACFHGLTSLQFLSLTNNTNLPPWNFPNLTHSTQLKELNLTATNVMGSLPEIFHSLPSMETLLLSNNNLSGVLPESFGGTKIANLHLNNQKGNGFSGPIDVLSNMLDLSQVWLQGNSFTGPIPDMSRCTSLQDLQLAHNRLTGVVPDSLTTLDLLQSISLNNNFLQGPLPEFAIYPEENVNLGVNTTNGFCHKDPGPCDHKVTILLEIAAELKYPILLARTWKGNNACKGWRFITCDDKNKIRMVNLSNLKLTGTISPAFANLTDLRELYLDRNNLTGEIPQGLTTLHELEIVNVSNNHLAGNILKFSAKVNFIATGNDFLVLPSNGSDHTPRRIPIALITEQDFLKCLWHSYSHFP